MSSIKFDLLKEELKGLQLAAHHLDYSLSRCADFVTWVNPSLDQLERLESLTSRFARLSDLLIQRIFRLIDEIELTGQSTVLDRIYRAEKRDWASAEELIKIRELRNLIAHEYAEDAMTQIYSAVIELTTPLLSAIPKVTRAIEQLLAAHEAAEMRQSP